MADSKTGGGGCSHTPMQHPKNLNVAVVRCNECRRRPAAARRLALVVVVRESRGVWGVARVWWWWWSR